MSTTAATLPKECELPLQIKAHKSCTTGHDKIYISRGSDQRTQMLKIDFKRTVRVADNDSMNELPPDLGNFPIYKVQDFDKLPEYMKTKKGGGYFITMYQREAMWINFESDGAFAVKIYVGGVNAVSGEPSVETEQTLKHRLRYLQEDKCIQDYLVVPDQLWLDGIASADGYVRQFVAMPIGSGYSIEAQLTGQETINGIQIEVTPAKAFLPVNEDSTEHSFCFPGLYTVYVRYDKKTFSFYAADDDTIKDMKFRMELDEGSLPVRDQQFFYKGKPVADNVYLGTLNMKDDRYFDLHPRVRGGTLVSGQEMGIAAGGRIKQTVIRDIMNPIIWQPEKTAIISVSIVSSQLFKHISGTPAPPSPITAQTYAEMGCPYFSIFNEKASGVGGGSLDDIVKSVNQLDLNGKGNEEKKKAAVEVSKDVINPVMLLNTEGKHVGFRSLREMEREVRRKFPGFKI